MDWCIAGSSISARQAALADESAAHKGEKYDAYQKGKAFIRRPSIAAANGLCDDWI